MYSTDSRPRIGVSATSLLTAPEHHPRTDPLLAAHARQIIRTRHKGPAIPPSSQEPPERDACSHSVSHRITTESTQTTQYAPSASPGTRSKTQDARPSPLRAPEMTYDWEPLRRLCRQLYIDEGLTLDQVMEYLDLNHAVRPSPSSLRKQARPMPSTGSSGRRAPTGRGGRGRTRGRGRGGAAPRPPRNPT
ncbi:hypothetical protein VTK73DRAFT_5778 [Phialemonium thermophilum]|uniref:Clr5 domain-containing protein n=1 Tax=Phialemonium thermophilum TaxID=223376 RepID=A0ABR3V1Q5_9PEZI